MRVEGDGNRGEGIRDGEGILMEGEGIREGMERRFCCRLVAMGWPFMTMPFIIIGPPERTELPTSEPPVSEPLPTSGMLDEAKDESEFRRVRVCVGGGSRPPLRRIDFG